jgi:hypothetical protein
MAQHRKSTFIEANEQNFPGGYDDVSLEPVHLAKKEARGFDVVQDPKRMGEPFIDEETELRSYEPLGGLLKQPEFRKFFITLSKEETERPPFPEAEQFQEIGEEYIENVPWIPAPGDNDADIKKIAKKGIKPDSIIVMMPVNMIYTLGEISDGIVNINPHTGLYEFGGGWSNPLKEVTRVATTLVGAVLGGAPGAALGNYAGQRLTGRNHKQGVGHGVKAGLTHFAVANVAPMLGMGSQGGGGMPSLPFFNQGVQGAALPQSYATQSGVQGVQPWGRMTSWTGAHGENLLPGGAQTGGSSAGIGNLFNGMTNLSQGSGLMNLVPPALTIAAGFMAKNAEKEKYKLAKEAEEERIRRQKELDEEHLKREGYYTPLRKTGAPKRINPNWDKGGEPYYLYEGDPRFERKGFKEGGVAKEEPVLRHKIKNGELLKGPGDGVSDSIHTKVPSDTFIVNAYTVAMLGNGDSEAGKKVIQEWLADIEKNFSSSSRHWFSFNEKNKKVDVALSTGEIPIFPSHVYMLGKGHLQKGIDLLNKLQEEVKKHKTHPTKGSLPPKAKSIEAYIA